MTFSQKLFELNDPICRSKIIEILGRTHISENLKDPYGIDILFNRKDLFFGIELERIYSWTTENIPFNRPRLIDRKYTKYNNNVLFLQFNRDLTKICIFTKQGVNIKDCRTITRGDVSFGTMDKHYEIHSAKLFTFDKIISFYNRINKSSVKIKDDYCCICKTSVSGLDRHIRRIKHHTKTKRFKDDIQDGIKKMTLKKRFGDIGLIFEP